MSHRIEVKTAHKKKYGIHVGGECWREALRFFSRSYSPGKAFIVLDERVNRFHGDQIREECSKYFERLLLYVVPEGETSKSIVEWNKLLDFALKKGVERDTPLLAFGGGVTGDLAGFVAATVLRGVPVVHFPTTLLAMVDSSIGGKTGVNHPGGKNLVGSFYQPDAVFCHTRFLETLEDREWVNGLSEILKYAAIDSPEIFSEVKKLLNDDGFDISPGWEKLIAKSAGIKASVVSEDALEKGKRAYLNFGHTFAHAIEKAAGYGSVSHGEAVFTGMIAATVVSKKRGAPIDEVRFEPYKPLYQLRLSSFQSKIDELIEIMYKDKKVKSGQLRLVLLEDWGRPVVEEIGDLKTVKEAWKTILANFD